MNSFEPAPDTPEPRKQEDLLDERELAFIGLDRKLMNLVTSRMVRELTWWANMRARVETDQSSGDSAEQDDPNVKEAGTLINFQLPENTVCTDAQYALQLEKLNDTRNSTLAEYTLGIALYEEMLMESKPRPQTGEWQDI